MSPAPRALLPGERLKPCTSGALASKTAADAALYRLAGCP